MSGGWGAAGLCAAMAAGACLSGACGQDRSEERRRVASGAGGARRAPEVPWELVYEQVVAGNLDLYLVPAAGGPARRLTTHPRADLHARWMPDGRHIVFTSDRTVNPQLFVLSVDGGEPRRLRRNDGDESQSDPSPDGRRLAFLSTHEGPQRLLVMDLAGGAVTEIVRHGERTILGNPHWSPDGSRIAFSSNWRRGHQIYWVDVVTREVRRVSPGASGGCEPRFSRDGRRVAYVSRGPLRPGSRLVERDLETGGERVLVDWPALNYHVAYSPDGAEVAFTSDITGEAAIYRQRLSDGRAWRVTFGGGAARYPDYRPVLPEAGR